MNLNNILRPEAVKVINSTSSKKRLFQELGELSSSAYELRGSDVADALLDRESLGPTGVGNGIALPHARLPQIEGVMGLFVRLEKPLEFGSVDRQPVDLVFALLAPEDSGVDHLKALALVSRTMRDEALCTKLRSNAEANTLHTLLTESTRVKAA